MGRRDGFGRLGGMVQCLTEDNQVNALGLDRRISRSPNRNSRFLSPFFLALAAPKATIFFRIIDRDDTFAASGQQLAQEPFAGPKVSNHQRRNDSQQQMAECLPGAARAVHTVESSGDVIKVHLRLLAASVENPLQINLIAAIFR